MHQTPVILALPTAGFLARRIDILVRGTASAYNPMQAIRIRRTTWCCYSRDDYSNYAEKQAQHEVVRTIQILAARDTARDKGTDDST